MTNYAHTAVLSDGSPDKDVSRWQPLRDHLRNVAELAGRFGEPFGMRAQAEMAGMLHDLGKYSRRFQDRLRDPTIHGVNHWAAGARKAAELRAWLVDYAVDGHHTGLPSQGNLRQSLLKMADLRLAHELTGCQETTDELTGRLMADGVPLPPPNQTRPADLFAAALQARMLFSCLVDGDFLDTENHFDPAQKASRATPRLQEDKALDRLRKRLARMNGEGPVNARRRQLLQDCLRAAEQAPGLFTLTAPTGSGKTLSSLAFALRHIAKHNAGLAANDPRRMRRVIVVIPYTSIIEQTAAVYRDLFEEEFGPYYILEHHSAVAPRESRSDLGCDAEEERLRRARLAAENWAPPLIITTSVQFFESLFSHRPSDCRKLHQVARSVILFDEVQTLPARLIPSLLSAVKLLTQEPYGSTAVFMTATQPAFTSAKAALPHGWEPQEIASDPTALAETMRRTHITLPGNEAPISWPDLATRLASHEQVLCVVNTTAHAREVFRRLPPADRYHLSARLCPAHRQEKLKQIRKQLAEGKACRLVSTQLIEAGVDVDFPVAFRAFGPLDSIIQTAGRCNREGHHPTPCPVVVFRPEDDRTPPGAYRTATEKTEEFLARHPAAALHQPDYYAAYFSELYALVGRESAEADPVYAASKNFDFPEAAARCRLVGEETRSVLVPWKEGEQIIAKLKREKHLASNDWRRAQRYSVNIYQGEFRQAQTRGYVVEAIEGVWYWNSRYDEEVGASHPEGDDFCL